MTTLTFSRPLRDWLSSTSATAFTILDNSIRGLCVWPWLASIRSMTYQATTGTLATLDSGEER